MECLHTNPKEHLQKISTCNGKHNDEPPVESSKVRRPSVNLNNPSHPLDVSSYYSRIRNRSVLLNLGISATLLAMLMLQMPLQSYCVMTPATLPVSSASPTTHLPPMTPTADGSYSLFPQEDLRTGKRIRFDDDRVLDRDRSLYRERDRYPQSYPIIFDERFMSGGGGGGRPSGGYVRGSAVGVGSSGSYPPYSQYDRNYNFNEPVRTRGSRVYFDDDDRGRFPLPYYDADRYRDDRYYLDRPTLLHRPISPISSQRPLSSYPDVSPGPSLSKLPVGATIGRSQYDRDGPYRIHVFNPSQNTFGNPRNRHGGFSETEAPGPDVFINHDQYLEYHRKVALARDEEFRKIQKALENKGQAEQTVPDTKKVLFSAKQPFDIGGLSPPPRDGQGSSTEGGGSTSSSSNNDIGGPLLSQPVEEPSLVGGNDKKIKSPSPGQVSLFTASDARVPLLTGSSVVEQGSANDNHNRVVHILGNDPGGVLSTTTGRSESSKSQGSVGENARGDKKNVEVEESENAKSQVTQIPPNFISKSGRNLAYQHHEQPSVHQVGSEGGRSTSTSTTYRTTSTLSTSKSTTSSSIGKGVSSSPSESGGGGGVNPSGSNTIKERNNGKLNNKQEGTDFILNARKSSTDFKTSGTGRIGHALPLVQTNNDDGFFRPSQPDFQIPVRIESSGGGGTTSAVPVSKLKAEKSGLGTEMTKNRIKINAASKIAIIRQQELKQIHKERLNSIKSYNDGDAHLNSVFNAKSSRDDELTKTASKDPIRITDRDIKNMRQSSNSSFSGHPVYKNTFKIPVLAKPSIVPKPLETDAVEKLLKDHEDPFKKRDSILGNNDVINNKYKEAENGPRDDGHFTLINLHNDRVKIVHDFDESGDNPKPQVEPPPLSQSYSNSPSFSDLDHGDALLFLGSNDALINKTLPDIMNYSGGKYPSSTAASTNFIRVVRVKNPLSLSPVLNNAATPSDASSYSSSNKTNDNLLLPFYLQHTNPLSEQSLLHIKNKTSANYVAAAALIAGASINKTGSSGGTNNVSTAEKTLSMFMAKKSDRRLKSGEHHYSSALNVTSSASYSKKYSKESYGINGKFGSKSLVIETDLGNKIGNGSQSSLSSTSLETSKSGRPRGVVSRVHAHVSHCPKLKAPAEIICDIHIRERHGHPNPQLTVGWRRKYYNSTQPDVLLVLNRTQAYDGDSDEEEVSDGPDAGEMKGWDNIDVRNTSDVISAGKSANGAENAKNRDGSMEDFHDKFNVTLAPGISPMLRSVLLIRGVTAPDCGNYQCEVFDGVNTLTSETLLFLCH